MCGICGFNYKNIDQLESMLGSIVHRGPDSSGSYVDNSMSLGMQRLSIVDLDAEQPVFNEDKSVIVIMNGEIYNHDEIRSDLENKGHKFITNHSDTEVIPHLFEEYEDAWVNYVNGMFAVAIWDKKRQRLSLYRDRIGKKPLYYSIVNKEFAFGSEIKSLLKVCGVSNELNTCSLVDYFQNKNTKAPNTFYRDIKQLLPGTFLVFKNNKIDSVESYWKPHHRHNKDIKINDYIEEFLYLLNDSVYIRTKCDVPFGAYLSGGIDSSSIVAVLSKIKNYRNIKTFCLGYKNNITFGKDLDIQFARELSKEFGTDHYELFIDHNDFIKDFPSVINAFDEPFSGAVSTYYMSNLIKKHVKVALSGDGADELFGSYLKIRLARAMQNELGGFDNSFLEEGDEKILNSFKQTGCHWNEFFSVFNRKELSELLNIDIFQYYLHEKGTDNLNVQYDTAEIVSSALYDDQIDLLPNQVLPFVDRLSMAHSVEVRCPYLDYRLIEFVNQKIPSRLKVYNGKTKIFQKRALLNGLLPKDIIFRKKEGFVQPIYYWMQNELKEWIKEQLNSLPSCIINSRYVSTLSVSKDAAKIWNLVCFSVWWNLNYKGKVI